MSRKKGSLFTDGQKNKIIDSFMHPLARDNPWFWAFDTLLHAWVEQNPGVTVDKFMRYNLPKIAKQMMKNQRRKTMRKTSYNY